MEEIVLQNLMCRSDYFTQTYSHLSTDLFNDPANELIYKAINEHVDKYSENPNLKEIGLTIKESNKINKNLKLVALEKFKEIAREPKSENLDFLLEKTKIWIQRQRLTKAVFDSADIIQADGEFDPIVNMFEEALNTNFDTDIGLDYQETIDERLEYYKSREAFTPLGLPSIDKIIGGGIRPGSLFLYIGPTHSGKTAAKVFTAANLLLKKENVLFITLEMPEKEIGKRIDANLMGTTINELSELPQKELMERWGKVKDNIGDLVIKEYGAGTFNTMQLRSLLDELKTKKDFIPDAIIVDYLGLMVSHRASKESNSYDALGKVAEDLHAIAKETYSSKGTKGIKMITSSQAGRCLDKNTILKTSSNEEILLTDVKVGDIIKGYNKDVKIKNILQTEKQKKYKIKLKSGKEIICSERHRFPTNKGLLSLETGLKEGIYINSNSPSL